MGVTDEYTGAISLNNYVYLFGRPNFVTSIFNTIVTALLSLVFQLVLGLGIATVLKKQFRGKGLIRSLVLMPMGIPTLVSGIIAIYIFSTSGYLNEVLFRAVDAFRIFELPQVLVGQRIPYLATYAYEEYSNGNVNASGAASTILLVIILVFALALAALCAYMIIPIYIIVKVSFGTTEEIMTQHPTLLPHAITLEHWVDVLTSGNVIAPLAKSFIVATATTVLSIVIVSPAAYIDGAGKFGTLLRVIFPVAAQGIAAPCG